MKNIKSSQIHIEHPHYLIGQSLLHPVFNRFHNGLSASWFSSEDSCSMGGIFDASASTIRCLVILSGSCQIQLANDYYILQDQDMIVAHLEESEFKIDTSHDFSCLELHVTHEFLEEIKTPSWEIEIFPKKGSLKRARHVCI